MHTPLTDEEEQALQGAIDALTQVPAWGEKTIADAYEKLAVGDENAVAGIIAADLIVGIQPNWNHTLTDAELVYIVGHAVLEVDQRRLFGEW